MTAVTATAATARRAADLAFLAGVEPTTIRLLGRPARMAAAAVVMGWHVVADGPADVCVCDGASWRAALAVRPSSLVIVGRAPRRVLESRGYAVRRALAWPHWLDPVAVATLDRGPLRQLFGLDPASHRRRLAGAAVSAGARLGLLPASAVLTVADRLGGRSPWPLRAAGPAPGPAGWLVLRGRGDDLQRLVFLGFDAGADEPRFAVKLGRVPAVTRAFDGDQAGLTLVKQAGPSVAAHTPAVLPRTVVAGFPAAVESAAAGRRMCDVLGGRQALPARLRLVEEVAAWTLRLAGATTGRLDRPAVAELGALAARGGRPGLSIAHLPGVLTHGDLGTWNVVVRTGGFTVVDWESARRPGLPLGDLAYFLADALTVLDGRGARRDQLAAMLRLFRGEAKLSPVLFAWIRRAAAEAGVAPEDVGSVLTLTWLEHAASPRRRADDLRMSSSALAGGNAAHARLAEPWLADTRLGWGWDRWRS